jgi:hypothetical protein
MTLATSRISPAIGVEGVTVLPGLALEAHRTPGIHATEIAGNTRQIFAVTYGEPPDPPATTALIDILETIA